MIGITLKGGLGNQMFQFATACAIAKRQGTSVTVDYSAYMSLRYRRQFELWRFEKLRLQPVHFWDALINQSKQRLGIAIQPPVTFRKDGLGFDEAVINLPNGSHITGWFQSARYFEDVASDISDMYDLTPFALERDLRTLRRLRDNGELVSIHVRRGDYADSDLFTIDLRSYYAAAIERISKDRNYRFLVFSDDLGWCRTQEIFQNDRMTFFDQVDARATIPLNEMALMASCDHNITCNSTFSWWAAWLNKKPNRVVIMPRQWLSRYTTEECGLSVDGWIEV